MQVTHSGAATAGTLTTQVADHYSGYLKVGR
jgi:hypothetical protein